MKNQNYGCPSAVGKRAMLSVVFLLFAFPIEASYAQTSAVQTAVAVDIENPRTEAFRMRDRNQDGSLTESEYVDGAEAEQPEQRRAFKVFDHDHDLRMTFAEFLTVPAGQAEELRGVIPDPVVHLSASAMADLNGRWSKWDRDQDGQLSKSEWGAAELGQLVRGLGELTMEDWDLNQDSQLSQAEVQRVLDIAFGVCIPSGERLRSSAGRVVDWITFRGLPKDAAGIVSREAYLKVIGTSVADPESWFLMIDKNRDGQFDFAEYATGDHRTDPVGMFLVLDKDWDGQLSLTELIGLPADWRQMAERGFRAFDDNNDGTLSLFEYQLMPHCNLLAAWQSAVDTDRDGRLSPQEFHFLRGLPLAALTAEYFHRLDLNRDQTLTLDEWSFSTSHPGAKFHALDQDSNELLTLAELVAEGSVPANRLSRDLKVLDIDRDGSLNLAEFMSLPYWIPADLRTSPPEPISSLAESATQGLLHQWDQWDRNGDGLLDRQEFMSQNVGTLFDGKVKTDFKLWDFDDNQQISRKEAGMFMEVAFGVRTPQGELLRSKAGRVVDWRMFQSLKRDAEGYVRRDDYFQALGDVPDRHVWFNSNDRNQDGKFNYAEFAMGDHQTDPVATFLEMDLDFNGMLSRDELEKLPGDRFPAANFLFPAFDDDGDGSLSLAEFRLSPVVNLLASWNSAQDKNNDGLLSQDEFRFYSGITLVGLCLDYFRRLDVNQDRVLDLDEFAFMTDHPSANETEIRVQTPEGQVLAIAIPDYPIICSPEISPDGKWVAVDGWRHGQTNLAAHLIVASLQTDEVRDLGTGCIPHWSADGQQLAYSKYGAGVFIRDFEANANDEELIDRQGWAIHFAPDGKSAAYVKGNNFIVYDLKQRSGRPLFRQEKLPYNYIEHNFCWSPDSQRIVFKGHQNDGNIVMAVVSVEGDDPQLRVRRPGDDVQSDFSWHPDGERVMFPKLPKPGQKTQLYVIDIDGDEPAERFPLQPKNRNNGGLCWSRDGKTLVYMSTR